MSTDPQMTHRVEQGIASFRAIAAGFGAFYRELIDEQKIDKKTALQMTLEYIKSWTISVNARPRDD